MTRIKNISTANLLAANRDEDESIEDKLTIKEEEGGAAPGTTSAGDIASVPFKLFGNKIIHRKRRNFGKVKRWKKVKLKKK